MQCSKCGSQIIENSKFCTECGAAVEKIDLAPEENTEDEMNELVSEPLKSENGKKQINKYLGKAKEIGGKGTNAVKKVWEKFDELLEKGSPAVSQNKKLIKATIIICLIILILMPFVGKHSKKESTKPVAAVKPIYYDLYFDVQSNVNIIFSTYDINVYIDSSKIGTIENGKNFTAHESVKLGEHTVRFESSKDSTVSGYKKITVYNNSTFKCSLTSKNDDIIIADFQFLNSIEDTTITMLDVSNMNLSEAVEQLKSAGFTNISYSGEGGKAVFDLNNWIVVSQNEEAGSKIDKSKQISLVCKKADSSLSYDYTGMNVIEAKEKAQERGYDVAYLNRLNLEDMSEKISSMDETEKAKWIVSKAVEDENIENFVKIYLIYSGEVSVPDLKGKSLSTAIEALKNNEFSNIKYVSNNGKNIENTDDWNVISQNVEPGSKEKANNQIVLTCKPITSSGEAPQVTTEKKTEAKETKTTKKVAETTKKVVQTTKKVVKTTAKSSGVSIGKVNALKSAESYLKFSAFSKKGLTNQLKFEKYTDEEVEYAVDNCGADWNEQAARCAESYIKVSSFSKEQLINQLEFEGFTHDQALYGVKAIGY